MCEIGYNKTVYNNSVNLKIKRFFIKWKSSAVV